VVNPGGPGASGVQYALQARSQVSAAVRARFDVVGFDPRGAGGSIPAVSYLAQARGFQVALRSFIADCLRRSACPFFRGESVTAAIARVQAMVDQAARKPLRSQIPGQPGDSALLLNGLAGSLYSTSFWPYLREGLTAAFAENGTLLIALGDLLVERDATGHYSNLVEAETAVDCVDRPWPRSLSAWQAAAAQSARAAPQFGAATMWAACRAPTGRCARLRRCGCTGKARRRSS
jgi:pimeloyl-ACP methyl ester carboxylesterase